MPQLSRRREALALVTTLTELAHERDSGGRSLWNRTHWEALRLLIEHCGRRKGSWRYVAAMVPGKYAAQRLGITERYWRMAVHRMRRVRIPGLGPLITVSRPRDLEYEAALRAWSYAGRPGRFGSWARSRGLKPHPTTLNVYYLNRKLVSFASAKELRRRAKRPRGGSRRSGGSLSKRKQGSCRNPLTGVLDGSAPRRSPSSSSSAANSPAIAHPQRPAAARQSQNPLDALRAMGKPGELLAATIARITRKMGEGLDNSGGHG